MHKFQNRRSAGLLKNSTDFFTQRKWAFAAAALALPAIHQTARADIIVWTNGAATNNWNGTDANWNDLSNSTNGVAYTDGSAVQFTDSGPGGSIAVGNVSGATPNGVSP